MTGHIRRNTHETMRSVMDVLSDHYMVRKVPDGMVAYNGKPRREAWEVRL